MDLFAVAYYNLFCILTILFRNLNLKHKIFILYSQMHLTLHFSALDSRYTEEMEVGTPSKLV